MALYFLTYLCFLIFALVAGLRILKQLTLPVHLRWELYPVKHEAGEKANYGGSYMEEPNWWEKKRKRSIYNELKYMMPEILFLRGIWDENRKLWWVSFPFHFGLYLLLGTFGLLLIGSMAMHFGVRIAPKSGGISSLIYYLTILTGSAGLVLGAMGASGLLCRRLFDPEMRSYSAPVDYINLIVFLFFFVCAFLAWMFCDTSLDGARNHIYSLLTFGKYHPSHTLLGGLTIVATSLIVAYVPLTHMSHMFMKYFTYHSVRWEDAPNVAGSAIERAILRNLGFKPTWAAPHIKADGKKTWAEIAASEPKKNE